MRFVVARTIDRTITSQTKAEYAEIINDSRHLRNGHTLIMFKYMVVAECTNAWIQPVPWNGTESCTTPECAIKLMFCVSMKNAQRKLFVEAIFIFAPSVSDFRWCTTPTKTMIWIYTKLTCVLRAFKEDDCETMFAGNTIFEYLST